MAVALAAVGLIAGAACGKQATPGAAGGTTTPPGGQGGYGGGYGQGGYGATSPSAGPAGGLSANTVQQGAGGQLRFSPATLSVRKGTELTIQNVGSADHTFTITGTSVDLVNAAGQTQKVAIDLAPGTYTFICRFHQALGMKGTITVTG
jgi:plastocyanin